MDASKLGTTVKDGKNQKTLLSPAEEKQIIDIFHNKSQVEGLSVVVTCDEIIAKNHSFSAGQYFDIKIEYTDITPSEFAQKMKQYENNLTDYFNDSRVLEDKIFSNLKGLKYE